MKKKKNTSSAKASAKAGKKSNKEPKSIGSGSASAGLPSEEDPESPLEGGDAGTAEGAVAQLREENDEDLSVAASAAHGSGSASAGLPSEEEPKSPPSGGGPTVRTEGGKAPDSEEKTDLSPPLGGTEGVPVLIVIPFKSSSAKADELRYALRAWDKFLPDCQILIVGDLPDYLCLPPTGGTEGGSGVHHIPHTSTSRNPQIDVAQKLLEVCKSPLEGGSDNAEHVTGGVPEYFIISNDDIYPVAPLTLTDLDLHTSMGRLGVRGSAGSLYRKNAANTLEALKKAGIKAPYDYATHTPVGVWRDELAEVIRAFEADKVGHLVNTLYFNTVWPDHRPILVDNGANAGHPGTQSYVASVYRKVPPAAVKKAFAERKFINNNDAGWSSVLPFLKKLFPHKSRFEK